MASSSVYDFVESRTRVLRAKRTQKSHGSFRLRGCYVSEKVKIRLVYRRLMPNGGALVRNSARSLKWLFIAYAPPFSELTTYIRACAA